MWVFGYGSLMWDGWEAAYNCVRREPAELAGYCRTFNKASTRNWGTKACPGATLNLTKAEGKVCCGIAFRFPEKSRDVVVTELRKREGSAFDLRELSILWTAPTKPWRSCRSTKERTLWLAKPSRKSPGWSSRQPASPARALTMYRTSQTRCFTWALMIRPSPN